MRPTKKQLTRATENGAFEQIDYLLSASNILSQIMTTLLMQADDIARENGLLLGEIKQASTRLDAAVNTYINLWRDLVRESGQAKLRMEDYLHYFPLIAHLLAIDPYVIDPNTGKPMAAGTPSPTLPALGEQTAAETGKGLSAHTVRTILQTAQRGGKYTYDSRKLTPDQIAALGEELKLTFQTHANLSQLFTIYAERDGRPKKDLLNEAMIEFVANH